MSKKLLTDQEARVLYCPFTYASGSKQLCQSSSCMAWLEVHAKVEREDHSGANVLMHKLALDTGRYVRREGPAGCQGTWILDAVGHCKLLL